MSQSTVAGAVAKRQESVAETTIRQYRGDFATVLPSHLNADHWVRVAQGLLRKNDQLRRVAERNPRSFLSAMLDCARQGLEPGVTYHLVPFGNEIVGIEDWTGLVELIYRAGAVSSVKCEVVYANDEFRFDSDLEKPYHRADWFGERGEMIGVYAYAVMKDGATSRVVVMGKNDLARIEAVSKTAGQRDSMWKVWKDRAWRKTAVKQLVKWVPSSPEYLTLSVKAERAGMADQPPTGSMLNDLPPALKDDEGTDITDAEVVDEPPPAATAPQPTSETTLGDPMTAKQKQAMFAALNAAAVKTRDERLALFTHATGRPVETMTDLTAVEASTILDQINKVEPDGLRALVDSLMVSDDDGQAATAAHGDADNTVRADG